MVQTLFDHNTHGRAPLNVQYQQSNQNNDSRLGYYVICTLFIVVHFTYPNIEARATTKSSRINNLIRSNGNGILYEKLAFAD